MQHLLIFSELNASFGHVNERGFTQQLEAHFVFPGSAFEVRVQKTSRQNRL